MAALGEDSRPGAALTIRVLAWTVGSGGGPTQKWFDTRRPILCWGSRIIDYRSEHDLTQADLAVRFGVSGPAIFKFEKGFVTPSLRLWLKIAASMGIPEKEAVLLWVREKTPKNVRNLIDDTTALDLEGLRADLMAQPESSDSHRRIRDILSDNPDLPPVLKTFVNTSALWDVLKPTAQEALLPHRVGPRGPTASTVEHLRDAVMVGRSIQNPGRVAPLREPPHDGRPL